MVSKLVRSIAVVLLVSPTVLADEPPVRDTSAAVQAGLGILKTATENYPRHRDCFSCHHQTLPLFAAVEARDAGLLSSLDEWKTAPDFTVKSFDQRRETLAAGKNVGGRAATVSYGLWTYHLDQRPPDATTTAMVEYLLQQQREDGAWKPPSIRPPLEKSLVSCTVLSAAGIRWYASAEQQSRTEAAIVKAITWLRTAPLEEHEDVVFALWGESLLSSPNLMTVFKRDGEAPAEPRAFQNAGTISGSAGASPSRNAVRQMELVQRLQAGQREDGGWGQLDNSPSDAYATGQAVWVLLSSPAPASVGVIERGVEWLRRNQEADGSWHVKTRSKPIQEWFDNGDPHGDDQFISIAATGWATAALARNHRTFRR